MTSRGRITWLTLALGFSLGSPVLAENLNDAWTRVLEVNRGLKAEQLTSEAQGLNAEAAHSARMPSVGNFTVNTVLTPSPSVVTPNRGGGASQNQGNQGGGGTAIVPGGGGFAFFGQGQNNFPLTNTYIKQPIYTGGRLLRNEDAARAQLDAQRSEEVRTALDLKQTVGEAYVGVLRAQRGLGVAESNVKRLKSFVRDVKNRLEEGLATRNDELSAEVSLSEAQQGLIEAQRELASAWARYNRYLCRAATVVVPLEEVLVPPSNAPAALADEAIRRRPEFAHLAASEIAALEAEALRIRPELVALTEQARGYAAQADAQMANLRPQVNLYGGYTFFGDKAFATKNYLSGTVLVSWNIFDSGATRRRSEAIRQQERATLSRRADLAADIALDVRTRWLELEETRRRIPLARVAVTQSEENVNVVTDRYREGLATYTQVLDAESQRIRSYDNYYNAVYDSVLASIRLHRAVGDL